MGLATLFSGNCRISNPILFCNPESPESPETTGIAGCRDPEVGSIATHLTFSCLTFDPVESFFSDLAQTHLESSETATFPNQAHKGLTRPTPVSSRVFSRPCPANPDTGPRRGCQGPTGGNEWQRKSAPRYAMHSGLDVGAYFSIKRTRYRFRNSSHQWTCTRYTHR